MRRRDFVKALPLTPLLPAALTLRPGEALDRGLSPECENTDPVGLVRECQSPGCPRRSV